MPTIHNGGFIIIIAGRYSKRSDLQTSSAVQKIIVDKTAHK